MEYINFSATLIAAIIYSSLFSWGFTPIEADGMQLFVIVLVSCPALLISSLVGLIKYKHLNLFKYFATPFMSAIAIIAPIINQTISTNTAAIGFSLSLLFCCISLAFILKPSIGSINA